MAIISDFIVPTSESLSTVINYYVAKFTDPGNYNTGDIVKQINKINLIDDTLVSSRLFNVNSGAFIAQDDISDLQPIQGDRISLTTEQLTITPAINFQNIPDLANYAEIHVWDAAIIFTLDGANNPDASTKMGTRVNAGSNFKLVSREELLNFLASNLTTSQSNIYIQYYFDINS